MKRGSVLLLTIFFLLFSYAIGSIALLGFSFSHTQKARPLVDRFITQLNNQEYEKLYSTIFILEEELVVAKKQQVYAGWLSYIPYIREYYLLYSDLVNAGADLATSTRVAFDEIQFDNLQKNKSIEQFDFASLPEVYLQVHPALTEALERIQRASERSERTSVDILPQEFQPQLRELQGLLATAQPFAERFEELFEVLPILFGQDAPHDIVVLLQNFHELRPTGGFIGSYARLRFNNGQIEQIFTDDVYNLDVNVLGREQDTPPQPIQQFLGVEHWYLRDANWDPDFPTAIQDIKRLYEYESGEEGIDTIIAITPYSIQRFLEETGPIEVNGITFTAESLVDELQYFVEQDFFERGLRDEERKVILNDLTQALKDRALSLSLERSDLLLSIFEEALLNKEILMHSQFPELQEKIVALNWAGELKSTDSDYIMVVDANLGALKTDRVVTRTRSYQVQESPTGELLATLWLDYKNDAQSFDFRTTRYRSYSRVYIPKGSQLISAEGFMPGDRTAERVQPQVYSEFDKTVIGGFFSVEPGESHQLKLQYRLPDWLAQRIRATNEYRLFVQKQPGTQNIKFSARAQSLSPLFGFAPTTASYSLENRNTIRFEEVLNTDQEYTITLSP